MTDFDLDVLQKKRTARSASNRKCGSKSKKCSLPSDRLTNKQWKERCGPVMSYSLGTPMKWDEFKSLPIDLQKEYITNLRNKYSLTASALGYMFGVQATTVRKYADSKNFGLVFPRGKGMNKAQNDAWLSFLGELPAEEPATEIQDVIEHVEAVSESAVVEDVAEEATAAEPVAVSKPVMMLNPEMEKSNDMKMAMREFFLLFTGKLDVNAIANSLKLILGEGQVGEMKINCYLA